MVFSNMIIEFLFSEHQSCCSSEIYWCILLFTWLLFTTSYKWRNEPVKFYSLIHSWIGKPATGIKSLTHYTFAPSVDLPDILLHRMDLFNDAWCLLHIT
jgi:hypothetical protein